MNILTILQQLSKTTSRNEKLAILEENKQDILLQRVFVQALDPLIQFYIRKIPTYKATGTLPTLDLDQAITRLYSLTSRQVTGNAAIDYLTNLLASLSEDDAKVLEMIIQKDLRCGVSDATVNKVWPGLIFEYPCMLCAQLDEKVEKNIKFPAIVQLKMDGMRFNAIVRNGGVEYRSRNGKLVDLRGHLDASFIELASRLKCDSIVFDGELNVMDMEHYQYEPRQIGNGILSKALKGTITEADLGRIHATIWDVIPYKEFVQGKSQLIYGSRLEMLTQAMEKPVNRLHMVWTAGVSNFAEAQQHFEREFANGNEGIILKDVRGHWEDKRVKHQVKFKGELECDLKIVDWEEGTGKNAGRLGALVLESKCGKLRTNVGTGFTEAQRENIDRSAVGKIVAIKYNGKIVDQRTGVMSLFLPVFIEIREDKSEADSLELIK